MFVVLFWRRGGFGIHEISYYSVENALQEADRKRLEGYVAMVKYCEVEEED